MAYLSSVKEVGLAGCSLQWVLYCQEEAMPGALFTTMAGKARTLLIDLAGQSSKVHSSGQVSLCALELLVSAVGL